MEAVGAYPDSQQGDTDLASQWEECQNLQPCVKTATVCTDLCSFTVLLCKSFVSLFDSFLPFQLGNRLILLTLVFSTSDTTDGT